MSKLTRSQFDSTYNQSANGSFKNNTSQLITAGIIRQFAKDIEDSVAFLSNVNIFDVANDVAITIQGNNTSFQSQDLQILRSGVANPAVGKGSSIEFQNTTSGKRVLMQNYDDAFQIFNTPDGSSYTERLRMDSKGKIKIGSTSDGVVYGSYVLGIESYQITSDASQFHINSFFQTEQTAATTNSIQGTEAYTKCSHPSGTITLMIGALGNIELGGAGDVTLATSVGGGFIINGSGTIATYKNFNAQSANLGGGGGVTTAYMFYGDVYPSGVTNKWGVYIADGNAVNYFAGKVKYGTDGTGGGTALLGANCPASTLTAPYKWITALSSDGSIVYIPAWK